MSLDDPRRQPAEERELFYGALTTLPPMETDHDENSDPGLDLGLSLGGHGHGHAWCRKDARSAASLGDRCRILTAVDFPTTTITHLPSSPSPSSSCSSSSFLSAARSGTAAGTKRHVDDQPTRHPEARIHSTGPGSVVVGWPPIRAYRVNNLVVNHLPKDNSTKQKPTTAPCANTPGGQGGDAHLNCSTKGGTSAHRNAAAKNEPENSNTAASQLVKVNMDGMPIGRKVDLTAYNSYNALTLALQDMFTTNLSRETSNTSKLLDGSSDFLLTYQDKDGDWMLVGDVPWGMFLNSVRRLRIMRTCDANVLAPGVQPNTDAPRIMHR